MSFSPSFGYTDPAVSLYKWPQVGQGGAVSKSSGVHRAKAVGVGPEQPTAGGGGKEEEGYRPPRGRATRDAERYGGLFSVSLTRKWFSCYCVTLITSVYSCEHCHTTFNVFCVWTCV